MNTMNASYVAIIFLAVYGLLFLIGAAIYILNGVAILKLCKKLNIDNGFLGFIPVACTYKLGQIADKACALQGQKKKYARTLLTLSIITLGLCFLVLIAAFALGIAAGFMGASEYTGHSLVAAPTLSIIIAFIVIILLYLGMFGVAIALIVYEYIVYYKIFKFFKPDSAVAFLVLSIFISGIQPIFLLICAASKEPIPYFNANNIGTINPEFNSVSEVPIQQSPQNIENQ